MQTYTQSSAVSNSMASFVARLMSLNAHEIQCLHSDSELMRQLSETQLLMESRLQDISLQSKLQAQLQQHQHQQQQQQHQQQLQPINSYYLYCSQALSAAHYSEQQQLLHQQHQQQQQHLHPLLITNSQLALDLRTTPTGESPPLELRQSHLLQQPRYGSSSSAASSPDAPTSSSGKRTSQASRALNPKKVKLEAYRLQSLCGQDAGLQATDTIADGRHSEHQLSDQPNQTPVLNQHQNQNQNQPQKKYKGEFDEPSPAEVEQRQRLLSRADNYHRIGTHLGECACVLGSQFRGKSTSSVLSMIEQWRRLDTDQRVRAKWDVLDLPKDIPLSDIKKFEELRREASNGRADFGGASKRKPLGIRGTRQFLLILYCLWGHPGREDVMQKEGYCPHCFAKIRKANEQSTLVRVVNHFNMKHRRGANPRLSPHRDTAPVSHTMALAAAAELEVEVEARAVEGEQQSDTCVISGPQDAQQLEPIPQDSPSPSLKEAEERLANTSSPAVSCASQSTASNNSVSSVTCSPCSSAAPTPEPGELVVAG